MRVFIAGYGFVAERIIDYLVTQQKIGSKNLFVSTYDDQENERLIRYLVENRIDFPCVGISDNITYNKIRDFNPDYIASIYYRHLIPQNILNLAKHTAFNLHPSLLPNYKGCFSAPWAIINGDDFTGITFHKMEEKVDCGDILWQKKIAISPEETGYSLYSKLCAEFIREFGGFFDSLVNDQLVPIKMPEGGSYYPRTIPYDGIINSKWDDGRIERFIRGIFFPPFKAALYVDASNQFEIFTFDDYLKVKKRA